MQNVTVFVYYKIHSSLHDQIVLKVDKFIKEISQKYPEIHYELMQRFETSNEGFETWLEIYHEVKKDTLKEFNDSLNLAAIAHDLPSQRKMEAFFNALL